jgi:hypothetical protein
MAKIQCGALTSELLPRPTPGPATGHVPDQLICAVEYGGNFQLTLAMNALYQPLRERIARLRDWPAAATRVGWHHLTAYLAWSGSAAWTAALQGVSERFEFRDVTLDGEPEPGGRWLIAAADFQGTWSASLGVDLSLLSGTTAATLDDTPGLPGFIAPAVERVGAEHVALKGMARVGRDLRGTAHLPLVAFDASVALDLERVYLAIAGMFLGDPFTWQEFLDGWDALFQDAVFTVQIRTGTYSLALVSSAQAYRDELRYYAQLRRYSLKQEEEYQPPSARSPLWPALVLSG